MPDRPSRAIKPPPIPYASIRWHGWIFAVDDVRCIAKTVEAKDPKLRLPEAADIDSITKQLEDTFDQALVTDIMTDLLVQQKADWFQRVERDARKLVELLGLTLEQCVNMDESLPGGRDCPGIQHLLRTAEIMPRNYWPPAELIAAFSGLPKIDQCKLNAAASLKKRGKPWDAATQRDVEGQVIAEILLSSVPRTLGLIAKLAQICAGTGQPGRVGSHSDNLRRALFRGLADVHQAMFGRGPRSRNKIGARGGASILWARMILQIAADRLPAACGKGLPNESEQASRIPAICELAHRADDTLADWLEEAAKSTTMEFKPSRRYAFFAEWDLNRSIVHLCQSFACSTAS